MVWAKRWLMTTIWEPWDFCWWREGFFLSCRSGPKQTDDLDDDLKTNALFWLGTNKKSTADDQWRCVTMSVLFILERHGSWRKEIKWFNLVVLNSWFRKKQEMTMLLTMRRFQNNFDDDDQWSEMMCIFFYQVVAARRPVMDQWLLFESCFQRFPPLCIQVHQFQRSIFEKPG